MTKNTQVLIKLIKKYDELAVAYDELMECNDELDKRLRMLENEQINSMIVNELAFNDFVHDFNDDEDSLMTFLEMEYKGQDYGL